MFNLEGQLWFGTPESLKEASRVEAQAIALAAKDPNFRADQANGQPDAAAVPCMYSSQDGVGIVTVRGALINADAWVTEMFGVATYAAIRQAFVYAASDQNVNQILLDIDSGGGAVSGVDDAANLIAQVNAVKPVTAYADNILASAAYWLASQAGEVFTGRLAMVGSIGIIATHMDYSAKLKQEGITATVLRSGKFKALVSPLEPLSDPARADLQSKMDATHAVFKDTVQVGRGMTTAQASAVSEGQTYMGAEAQKVKLTDGVSTFDATLARVSKKSVDNKATQNNTLQKRGNTDMSKKARAALPSHLLTALASGIELSDEQKALVAVANAEADAAEVAAVAALAAAEAAAKTPEAIAAAAVAAEAATVAAAAAAAATVAAAAAAVSVEPMVALLREQLREKDAEVLKANIGIAALTAEVASMKATHTSLLEIARGSLTKMSVALGGAEVSLDTASAEEVLKQHASVSAVFKKKFNVGGVAAVTGAEDAAGEVKAAPSHAHTARIKATHKK